MTRSRTVLDYSALMKRLVDEAKQPGFTADSWAPLAELIDTENFVRVGNFKEVMNWEEYVTLPDQLGDIVGVGLHVQAGHRGRQRGVPGARRAQQNRRFQQLGQFGVGL